MLWYKFAAQFSFIWPNILCLFVCLSGLLLGNDKVHKVQTRWVGGAWSNLDFMSNFLVSCYYWSSLHEFLWFFRTCYVAFGSNLVDGRSLGWLCFWSNLLSSSHDRSLLHEFLSFLFLVFFSFLFSYYFCHTSLHKAQPRCAGGAWSIHSRFRQTSDKLLCNCLPNVSSKTSNNPAAMQTLARCLLQTFVKYLF